MGTHPSPCLASEISAPLYCHMHKRARVLSDSCLWSDASACYAVARAGVMLGQLTQGGVIAQQQKYARTKKAVLRAPCLRSLGFDRVGH